MFHYSIASTTPFPSHNLSYYPTPHISSHFSPHLSPQLSPHLTINSPLTSPLPSPLLSPLPSPLPSLSSSCTLEVLDKLLKCAEPLKNRQNCLDTLLDIVIDNKLSDHVSMEPLHSLHDYIVVCY